MSDIEQRISALEASNRCRLDEVLDCHKRIAAVESYMQRIKAMEAAAMQPRQDAKPCPCGGGPWPEPLPPPKDDAERIARAHRFCDQTQASAADRERLVQQDAKPFLCPHCGKECKTWFDRTMDEQGRMATRCEHCGRDVGDDAKPDADEAAVEAIRKCIQTWIHEPRPQEIRDAVGAIVTAIRAGKVPGIWCRAYAEPVTDEPAGEAYWRERCREHQAQHVAKDDQIAALRRENEALKRQPDPWILAKERDKALAELAAERAKLPDFQRILAAAQRVNMKLEKALSDTNTTLIEARETYRRAMAEITAERDQLKADLAALRRENEALKARVAELERERDLHRADATSERQKVKAYHRKALDLADHRDRLKDDLAAMTERAATLSSELAALKGGSHA